MKDMMCDRELIIELSLLIFWFSGWLRLKTFHDIVLAVTITMLRYHYARDYVTMNCVNYCVCPIITVLSSQRQRSSSLRTPYIQYKTILSFSIFDFSLVVWKFNTVYYIVISRALTRRIMKISFYKLNYIHAEAN